MSETPTPFQLLKGLQEQTRAAKREQQPAVSVDVAPVAHITHRYAAKAVGAELARLDSLARPWHEGANWDTTTYEVACNLIEIANSPWSGYTLEQAEADLRAHAPRDDRWGAREHAVKWSSARSTVGAQGRPEPSGMDVPGVTVLEYSEPEPEPVDEPAFWSERPLLQHLHDFARARRVSPWAVLGVTLARIVTATPHQVCLPPIVGGKASLNLFVGLVGPSGAGKGAAEAVAADALHVGAIISHNVGSGEGIAHGYKRRGKQDLEWLDDEHAVLFSVPEIDSLAAQGDRRGATLMPQLRSGWTGEQLGFGYADPTKRIIVEAHQYRLCLVAGIQPGRAGCLLDDADGGTPQRFLWMPATDPNAPDIAPDEPEPMTWACPPLGSVVGVGGVRIGVCQEARETITAARLARLRGEGDALDGHALLARLKVAAALALAAERLDVSDDDWRLAGIVAAKSNAVRQSVVRTLQQKAESANTARADAEAQRAMHVAEKVQDSAVRRVARALHRRLVREGDWCTRTVLRGSVGARDRMLFDDAIEGLIAAGVVTVEVIDHNGQRGQRYRASEAKS